MGRNSISVVDDQWIWDSGCGHDMVAEHQIKHLMRFVQKDELQEFNTANGTFESDDVVSLSFSLGKTCFEARPYLMEESPSVLSMGKRCLEEDFCYCCGSRGLILALLLPWVTLSRSLLKAERLIQSLGTCEMPVGTVSLTSVNAVVNLQEPTRL